MARQRDSAREKFLRSSPIRTQDHRVTVAFKIGNRPELSALPCRLLGIYKYNRSISLCCRRLYRPLQFDTGLVLAETLRIGLSTQTVLA